MKKKLYGVFALQYLIMFSAFGALFPFIGPYAKNALNASGSDLALISSLAPAMSIISLLIIGFLCDYFKKYKVIFNVTILLAAIALFLMSLATTFMILLIFYLFYRLVGGSLIAVDDTIAGNKTKEMKMNYGFIRGCGSLGYIIGSLTAGFLINHFDNSKAFLYYALSALSVAVIITLFYPTIKTEKEPAKLRDLKLIFKNKNYIIVVLTISLVLACTNTAIIYDGILLDSLGKANLIGYMSLFSASPELIMMPIFIILIKKLGYKRVLLLGTALMSVRWLTIYLLDSHYTYFGITLLHGTIMGVMIPTGSYYIINNMNSKTISSAMTFNTASSSFMAAIIGLLAGTIYDFTGNIRNVYLVLLTVTLLALLMGTLFNRETNNNI